MRTVNDAGWSSWLSTVMRSWKPCPTERSRITDSFAST